MVDFPTTSSFQLKCSNGDGDVYLDGVSSIFLEHNIRHDTVVGKIIGILMHEDAVSMEYWNILTNKLPRKSLYKNLFREDGCCVRLNSNVKSYIKYTFSHDNIFRKHLPEIRHIRI